MCTRCCKLWHDQHVFNDNTKNSPNDNDDACFFNNNIENRSGNENYIIDECCSNFVLFCRFIVVGSVDDNFD